MRVLVATSTFPLREGDGTPRFVQDLCGALAAHCDVRVLAPHAPGAARAEELGGLRVTRFPYFVPRGAQRLAYGAGMPDNLRSSWLAKLQAPGYLLAQARAVRRLCARESVDVVNSHWIVPTGLATAMARGRGARFRHVVTLHGGDAHLLANLPGGPALARWVVERSDALIAVSSKIRDALDATLGRPSGAVVQPVGVDTGRFREGPAAASPFPDGYLLFVGRLIRIKGVDVLLRALARVREAHPGVGLVVVGDGPEREPLAGLARELGQEAAVRFPGAQSHDEVAAWLRGCRAAVVPSVVDADGREEGMPAIVAEALAAGARVVASATGGIPDVLRDAENGWLARPGDAQDLATRVQEALALPRPSALDAQAAETASELDWSRVALAYRSLFEPVT
ncbi:MAG: glycosyltransferase [Myxococcota bacterium]